GGGWKGVPAFCAGGEPVGWGGAPRLGLPPRQSGGSRDEKGAGVSRQARRGNSRDRDDPFQGGRRIGNLGWSRDNDLQCRNRHAQSPFRAVARQLGRQGAREKNYRDRASKNPHDSCSPSESLEILH